MELKTKKIVAREGLIILGILFISGLLLFSSSWMRTSEWRYERELDARLKDIKNIENKSILDIPTDTFHEKYSDVFSSSDKLKFYREYENITEEVGFLILFTVYPLILIIRFILWAVSTLKK